jgi:hypothetical protein
MKWLLALPALSACVAVGGPPPSQAPAAQPEASAPVDPEQAAWAEKQVAFDTTFASEVAAYRVLAPRLASGDVSVIAEADQLRSKFVSRCVEESQFSTVACWNGTFARDITEALAKLRLQAGDKVGSYLESYTLYSYPDLRSEDAKRQAARSGIDDAPANIRAPEALRALEEQMEFVGETVRAVVRGKTTAVIRFEARDSSRTDYACEDPQVVVVADRTTASGNKLALKQKCKVSGYQADHETFPSVTVPLAEAETIKPGQRANVVFAKRSKKGHVMDVWPDTYTKTYVRFRTTRMKKATPGYP